MYNGIGLSSARGSGTNGYVQRNLSTLPRNKQKIEYKTEDQLQKLDLLANKPPNAEILEHQRKREIEVKVLEYRDELEERGLSEDEIERKLDRYRNRLKDRTDDRRRRKEKKYYEFFKDRKLPTDTHQYNQLNLEKNESVKNAFGISKYFKEGSSLDPARRAKEAEARSADLDKKARRYELVRTPSPEREGADDAIEKALEIANKKSKH